LSLDVDESALCVVRSTRGTATGFAFLRPEWYVTAKHALAESEQVGLELAGGRTLPARVALRHARFDLAVAELAAPGPCRVPFRPAADAPESGTLLCVCAREVAPGASLASSVSRVDSFERTRRRRDGGEETLYMFPAPAGEAVRSGSPLVSLDGLVVAVVTDGIRLDGVDFLRATAIAPLLGPLASLGRAQRP
jgi:S1-C subfamily serine protease